MVHHLPQSKSRADALESLSSRWVHPQSNSKTCGTKLANERQLPIPKICWERGDLNLRPLLTYFACCARGGVWRRTGDEVAAGVGVEGNGIAGQVARYASLPIYCRHSSAVMFRASLLQAAEASSPAAVSGAIEGLVS